MSTCKLKTNSTKAKTCDSYIGCGMCGLPEMFRCVEYIEKFEPRLSHSGITSFLRCPQLYYYSNIMGLQVKPQFQSDALKIGSAVDDYITNILLGGEPTEDTVLLNDEIKTMWEAKAIAIIRAFNKLMNLKAIKKYFTGQREFLIQNDGQPSIKGFIDLHAATGKQFVELKVGNPDYYIHLFYIRSKLAAYFMSLDTYETGVVWAIRRPDLKRTGNYKNESLEDFSDRCYKRMIKEVKYYFPGYNRKSGNFGVRFGRAEIDLDATMKQYRIVADYIKLAVKQNTWVKNGTGCLHPFECDYLPICQNNGAISEDVFTRRKKESKREKIQS